jgi:Flp pilus assembly protein TadG
VSKFGQVLRALRNRGRARRDERGSVIVEAAIIVPLLILLTFGVIEYGIAFRESGAVKASSRAGVRAASALPRNALYLQTAADAVTAAMGDVSNSTPKELWIYHASTNGGHPATCSVQCALYTWNGTKFVLAGGNAWAADAQNACASADNPNLPEQVGVYVKASHKMITGFFGASSTLTSTSVMRLEPYVGTGGCGP